MEGGGKGGALARTERKARSVRTLTCEFTGWVGVPQLTILLPSLRILDTHRFDAKHAELKAARSARTAEQKILDAGPIALALNEQSAAPIQVDELLKERERERENKRRRKKGIQEQVGEGKKRRREERQAEEEEATTTTTGADTGQKRVREASDLPAAAVGIEEEDEKPKKPKKRTKAERKALAKARTTDDPTASSWPDTPAHARKGGALDALRGGDVPPAVAAAAASKATAAPAAGADAEEELRPDQVKQKTSVAKIIDVRKAEGGGGGGKKKKKHQKGGDQEAAKVDVGALLGLAPARGDADSGGGNTKELELVGARDSAAAAPAADPLGLLGAGGAGTGSGLFGTGGWD